MPSQGRTGQRRIPGKVSGFAARPAGIYLPPAALVANAPRLPVVVMMLGQPGNPDPGWVARALDPLARQHGGLAPIVVVADQIGKPTHDTLCLNTKRYGNVETYLTVDVVAWIRQNLNVSPDPQKWTIAGYSNGGQCAISLAAKHPDLWGNVMDISGEAYPGQEHPGTTLREIFRGDQAAYEAAKPGTILAQHRFPGMWGYFSFGTDDATYGPGVRELARQAAAADMTVRVDALPKAGHAAAALQGGLANGFAWLYPHWRLDSVA
jgi:enterochelin esterase-like enzyme